MSQCVKWKRVRSVMNYHTTQHIICDDVLGYEYDKLCEIVDQGQRHNLCVCSFVDDKPCDGVYDGIASFETDRCVRYLHTTVE